tara:strand:- start:11799 stop:12302 length:504 start_codon:yes stop_codon:yes gene_type:complete
MADYDLAYKKITELPTAVGVPVTGDYHIRYDASQDGAVKIDAAVVEIVTTTNVIAAAETGKTYILNSADAFVTTLPLVEAGLHFTFYAGATQVTGGNHTIVINAANDNTIFGDYNVAGATVPASAEGSINWVADTMLPGDKVEIFCDGTNWYISGSAAASGAVTFTT